ncbi:hypothetical protein QCA22_003429 [Salmonella enterica]|nr:hypothetical protein [Salmonella enterica]EKS5828633.1 hypothetical protein [Salmonella enterica]EKS5883109.1 hypothetical protein [Salmonella enterica]
MEKKYSSENGYTLLEVIFVLIFIALFVIGSIYYIHYEKVFSSANSIAKQFNYIADSVIKFDWGVPDKDGETLDYSVNQLIKKGVLKGNMRFLLNYGVRMYWNDKKSYTVLVYVKTPVSFPLDDLASISGLIGPDGGYINNKGEIVMSAARIWNNIISKKDLGIRSDTPVLIRQVGMTLDPKKERRMNMFETIVQSGSVSSSVSFFSDDTYTSNIQEWSPAFTDDEINISWGNAERKEDNFSATLKDVATDRVIYKTSGWGNEVSLYPKSSWLSKRVVLSINIYNGVYVTTTKRYYDISPKGLSSLNAEFSVAGYVLKNNNQIARVSLSQPVKLHNGSPFVLCLNRIELSLAKEVAKDTEHWLLVPIFANIVGNANNTPFLLSNYEIEKIPFSWERYGAVRYDAAKSECVFFSNAQKNLSIAIDSLYFKEMNKDGMVKKGSLSNREGVVISWN